LPKRANQFSKDTPSRKLKTEESVRFLWPVRRAGGRGKLEANRGFGVASQQKKVGIRQTAPGETPRGQYIFGVKWGKRAGKERKQ